MSERRDKDRLERSPSPGAPATTSAMAPGSLPTAEPGERSLEDQRHDLLRMIDELDGTLRYMGQSHPQRRATETRLASLKQMLAQLDAAIAARAQVQG